MKKYPIFLTIIAALAGYVVMYQFTRMTYWSVDIESEIGGNVKWYIDTGNGFSEREGGYAPVPHGERSTVTIALPSGTLKAIRLDPIESDSKVLIGNIRWEEPWPGNTGRLNLDEAEWSNFSSLTKDEESGRLVLEPLEDVQPDIFGVWEEVSTHSSLWWMLIRLPGAILFGLIAFVGGLIWNKSILKKIETEADEVDPPMLR